ncbi:MAG: KOW domain-containing RNA-binding protein [Clostridia bacterium]
MQRGTIVKSKLGRDKDFLMVVLSIDGKRVIVADGKKRPLERPKSKNVIHLAFTKTVLQEESLLTNKQIKKALREYKLTEVI